MTTTSSLNACAHADVECVNPYELIRKYRCNVCDAVMMCACDEEHGTRFLPHQLRSGSELETRKAVPVTHGFQNNICRECRGLASECWPKAAIHGQTTKIRRFYWREISFETTRRVAVWEAAGGELKDKASARKKIEKEVVAEIKAVHDVSSKYNMAEPSDADIIAQYQVEVVKLSAAYAAGGNKSALIVVGEERCSVEEYVSRHYRQLGYEVLALESPPFHALFGVFTWLVIQDPDDPQQQFSTFGDRNAFERKIDLPPIHTFLPSDFGAPGYAKRRESAIDEHWAAITWTREELLWLFDYSLEGSEPLRQYLWAHHDDDIARARRVVEILSPDAVRRILKYLLGSYWKRYLGWPDLLVFKDKEFFFVEVKSSGDGLSGDQKDWIAGNAEHLHFPFRIAKVHRTSTME